MLLLLWYVCEMHCTIVAIRDCGGSSSTFTMTSVGTSSLENPVAEHISASQESITNKFFSPGNPQHLRPLEPNLNLVQNKSLRAPNSLFKHPPPPPPRLHNRTRLRLPPAPRIHNATNRRETPAKHPRRPETQTLPALPRPRRSKR